MKTSVAVLALTLSLAASTAMAEEIPPACQESNFVMRGYLSGVAQGKSLVQRAWLSVNNCDELERFTDIVVSNVQNYVLTGASTYAICRHSGLLDGVFQQLDDVWLSCDGMCCQEGEVIGELSAELYCQLSILLDGLAEPDDFIRRPVYMCGFAFETCCDASFVGTSMSFFGLDGKGALVACKDYTEQPFFEVWDGTREIQCAYEPPPEP